MNCLIERLVRIELTNVRESLRFRVSFMKELSFEENIASRGWHYYGKDVWKNPKTGERENKERRILLR